MPKNLAAITAPGHIYPEYISINVVDPGVIRITVREEPSPLGACGDIVSIDLTTQQWSHLLGQIGQMLINASETHYTC